MDDETMTADAAATVPDEITITFRKPVTFAGETYASVSLREPTSGEWELWDKLSGVAANIKAISTIGAMPEGAVKQIGVRDFNQAVAFIDHFY